MLLKYIGPKARKLLDQRWGKSYLFAPPSMVCEVADKDAKFLLAECPSLFTVVTLEEAAKTPEPVKPAEVAEATRGIAPKFMNHFGGKRGRPKKNGNERPKD